MLVGVFCTRKWPNKACKKKPKGVRDVIQKIPSQVAFQKRIAEAGSPETKHHWVHMEVVASDDQKIAPTMIPIDNHLEKINRQSRISPQEKNVRRHRQRRQFLIAGGHDEVFRIYRVNGHLSVGKITFIATENHRRAI